MNTEKSLSEALNFMREGEVAQAEFLLNSILKTFPKNSDALTQKGIILIHKRKFKKGIDLIKFFVRKFTNEKLPKRALV